jgi:hypothetical protein
MFFAVSGGTVSGPRINGVLLPGGGDWLTIAPAGWGRIDVRGQIRTDDGAHLFIHYGGWLELNSSVMGALQGSGETSFTDQYYRATPRIESGAPAYAWVNQRVFIGKGRMITGPGIEVAIFEIL